MYEHGATKMGSDRFFLWSGFASRATEEEVQDDLHLYCLLPVDRTPQWKGWELRLVAKKHNPPRLIHTPIPGAAVNCHFVYSSVLIYILRTSLQGSFKCVLLDVCIWKRLCYCITTWNYKNHRDRSASNGLCLIWTQSNSPLYITLC